MQNITRVIFGRLSGCCYAVARVFLVSMFVYGCDNKSMQNRFVDWFWDLPNASRFSLESILSLDFNSRWRSNPVFIRILKCSWRRVLKSACAFGSWLSHVISPWLRMLLWREIIVNTAHCEHPCNSLQPFRILWMIILGSSVCKDLETSRVRLILKLFPALVCMQLLGCC